MEEHGTEPPGQSVNRTRGRTVREIEVNTGRIGAHPRSHRHEVSVQEPGTGTRDFTRARASQPPVSPVLGANGEIKGFQGEL